MMFMWRHQTDRKITYHSLGTRAFGYIAVGGGATVAVLALAASVSIGYWGETVPVALFFLVMAAALYRLARARLELSADLKCLTVVNPLQREEIAMSAVSRFRSGNCLQIELAGGRSVTVWALQRANLTQWRGGVSNADRAAAELEFIRINNCLPAGGR